MSRHAYPRNALYADYVRSLAGMAITAIPLVFAELLTVFFYIFAGLWLLFCVYGVRTLFRQLTVFELSDDGLAALGPRRTIISWPELQDIQLKYFSTQRDKKNGWMQLKIVGRDGAISIDSTLQDFDTLAQRVVHEARDRRLDLNPSTQTNLQLLGIHLQPGQS